MKIALVAPFCSLPDEPHFNRFWYLAERLAAQHNVTLFTSNFRHYNKTFRRPEAAQAASQGRLNVILLQERGYHRNVSIARLLSHHDLVQDLERHLNNAHIGEWDAVYSAYPLIATNILLGKHKQRLGYKLIIDVQDVWPESFSAVLPVLQKLPHRLLPFTRRADTAYRAADALAAVSHTYLKRAQEANPNVDSEVVYIGADYDTLQPIATTATPFSDGRIHFFYLGTLSHSYDIATICRGINRMAAAGKPVCLHIIGGGPDFDALQSERSEAVHFHGFLPYADMMALAARCHIAVNAIHAHSVASITNKLSDYLALGKPILNSQSGQETAEIVSLLPHANYQSGNIDSFISAAETLMQANPTTINHAEIAHRFKRSESYGRLVNLIERTVKQPATTQLPTTKDK